MMCLHCIFVCTYFSFLFGVTDLASERVALVEDTGVLCDWSFTLERMQRRKYHMFQASRGFGCNSIKGAVDVKAITFHSIKAQHNEIPFYSLPLLSQMESAQSWR